MSDSQSTINPHDINAFLTRYMKSANELSNLYGNLNAEQRLGVTHAIVGLLFIILGIAFFFQSFLLSIGNGFILYGIIEVVGIEEFVRFLKPPVVGQSNYGLFAWGVSLLFLMSGWGMIGFALELYSIYHMLKDRCDNSELKCLATIASNFISQGIQYFPLIRRMIPILPEMAKLSNDIHQSQQQAKISSGAEIAITAAKSETAKTETNNAHPEQKQNELISMNNEISCTNESKDQNAVQIKSTNNEIEDISNNDTKKEEKIGVIENVGDSKDDAKSGANHEIGDNVNNFINIDNIQKTNGAMDNSNESRSTNGSMDNSNESRTTNGSMDNSNESRTTNGSMDNSNESHTTNSSTDDSQDIFIQNYEDDSDIEKKAQSQQVNDNSNQPTIEVKAENESKTPSSSDNNKELSEEKNEENQSKDESKQEQKSDNNVHLDQTHNDSKMDNEQVDRSNNDSDKKDTSIENK